MFFRHALEEGQYYPLRLNGNTQKISWISKNEKVALVTSRGFVIARSKGKTSIYARVGTRYFKCEVKVLAKKKPKVTPTATPTPKPTATLILAAIICSDSVFCKRNKKY